MQFTEQVNWNLFDFAFAGVLLFATGLAYSLVAQKGGTRAYRAATGIALWTALLLIWVNGAVGIIGSENNPANLLYSSVLAILVVGALIARFQARRMALALFVTAIAQMSVPFIALIVWPSTAGFWGDAGIVGVIMLNTLFAILFAASGLLFWQVNASIGEVAPTHQSFT